MTRMNIECPGALCTMVVYGDATPHCQTLSSFIGFVCVTRPLATRLATGMSDYDSRLMYPTPGEEPVTETDFTSCDSQSVLCLGADLLRLTECEYEGKQAYIAC